MDYIIGASLVLFAQFGFFVILSFRNGGMASILRLWTESKDWRGPVSRFFGIVGIRNSMDILHLPFTVKGQEAKSTVLYIKWAGAILRLKEEDPRQAEWVFVAPWAIDNRECP